MGCGDDRSRSRSRTGAGVSPLNPSAGVPFRRKSTNERLDEILEGGRERADTMAWDPSRQPSSQTQHEAAPDETTGMVSRGSEHNYQALHAAGMHRPKLSFYRRASSRGLSAAEGEENCRNERARNEERSAREGGGVRMLWLRRMLANLRSVELENKGSVARDHLALERTFLAWLRTSLAFASIGIAVTQLFRLNTTISDGNDHSQNATLRRLGKPLGAAFLGISILTLLLGARRYFLGQEWVIKGKFPASRGTVIVVALAALAIMLVSLVVVIVIHSPEKEL